MAARLAPDNVRRTHQSLHHLVATSYRATIPVKLTKYSSSYIEFEWCAKVWVETRISHTGRNKTVNTFVFTFVKPPDVTASKPYFPTRNFSSVPENTPAVCASQEWNRSMALASTQDRSH